MSHKEKAFSSFFRDMVCNGLELFGLYYSSYLGVVANLEDPLKMNRIQLIIPQVCGNDINENWAFPKGLYSGNGHGIQLLPQKGDIVRVEFENGNPDSPLWMHAHYAQDERPTDEDLDDKKCFWLITPNGHKVIINDTKNYLIIKDNQGNEVNIDSKGWDFKVANEQHINLGANDEQAILGNKAISFLEELITIFQDAKVLTLMGPQPFMPDTQLKLLNHLKKLEPLLSKTVNLK